MQTQHLWSKCGARIIAIHAVAHSMYKGAAQWYFMGDLEFSEVLGKPSVLENREIGPGEVCYMDDAGKPECDAVMKALNDYLLEKGKWHKAKHLKDGRVIHWTPKQPTGLVPLEAFAKAA